MSSIDALPAPHFFTEEEPDDDFLDVGMMNQSEIKEVGSVAPQCATDAKSGEDEAVSDNEDATLQTLRLAGCWHQLEGVPRSGRHRRFLAWNDRGHVAIFPEDNRIEVAYAGGETHRVVDHSDLNMAAMSHDAVCLAASAESEGGTQLQIRPAQRWDKPVFTAALGSRHEAVEAVACGAGFAAALTSHSVLRVYAPSGLPIGVVSVAGRTVALAARGPFLLVVTGAHDVDSDDALEFRLLDVKTRSQRSAGRLPLSRESRLRWLGFTTELIPLAIDSVGVGRALLGTGAGSWGPSIGGGGEWTPVLSLADEEARVGPLWAVYSSKGVLYCAEAGLDAEEPQPEFKENASQTDVLQTVLYGQGAALVEVAWRLPLGPLVACGALAEQAMREQLLARHVEEMNASGALLDETLAGAKNWKSRALTLFAQLLKVGEVERALDVAKALLVGAGGTKLLQFARDLAERDGQRRLADEVAALANMVVDTGSVLPLSIPTPHRVPKVMRRETASTLVADGLDTGNFASSSSSMPASQTFSQESQQAPAISRVASAGSFSVPPSLSQSSLLAPQGDRPMEAMGSGSVASQNRVATTPTAARPLPSGSSPPPATDLPEPSGRQLAAPHNCGPDTSRVAVSRGDAASVPESAVPVVLPAQGLASTSSNPFARQRAAPPRAAPHILRDTLGRGPGRGEGEPALKSARTTA